MEIKASKQEYSLTVKSTTQASLMLQSREELSTENLLSRLIFRVKIVSCGQMKLVKN